MSKTATDTTSPSTRARGKASGDKPRKLYVLRAELRLAHSDDRPLRRVPLRPDPLSPIAAAVRDLDRALGESVDICIDLLPVRPAQVSERIAAAAKKDRGRDKASSSGWAGSTGEWSALFNGGPLAAKKTKPAKPAPGKPSAGDKSDHLSDRAEERWGKGEQAVFAVQVLIRVQSTVQGRARAQLAAVLSAFDQWSAQNRWRVAGVNLGGAGYLGADLPFARSWFDRRFTTGRFKPVRKQWLTGEELAGLLKPPTASCFADNVARSGGMVPLPPQGLATYRPGDPGLFYAGIIDTAQGERHVGVPIDDTFFTIHFGRSRWGKSEIMLARFLALVLAQSGRNNQTGALLLDPHRDGIQRIKAMLTTPELAARVLELDLTRGLDGYGTKSPGWNPLSMENCGKEDIDEKVAGVVDAVSSTLGWGDQAPRAKTLLSVAAETLCHLALRVPPELAPTVFQIPTLLTNAEWRDAVVPVLPPSLQQYWLERFPRVPGDATTVVTNLFDRLRTNKNIVALLGSSRSTFDMRRAMDAGAIVLVCPGDDQDKSKLMSCLIIFELLRAAKSRQNTDKNDRRRFDAFLDELAALDGAARGNVASILEQTAKFGLRLHGANQLPSRLTKTTLAAFLGNASHVFTTALSVNDATPIAREWGGVVTPDTISQIDRYSHIGHLSVDGRRSRPFRFRGPEVNEFFADFYRPDRVAQLDIAIDASMRRRPMREILEDLETLEPRIVEHLSRGGARQAPPPSDAGPKTDAAPHAGRAAGASGARDHVTPDTRDAHDADDADDVDLTPRSPAAGGSGAEVVDMGAARKRRGPGGAGSAK